ncbi:MAG: hypothetical protein ACKO2L_20320 [Planctomycetaceae bacterium]
MSRQYIHEIRLEFGEQLQMLLFTEGGTPEPADRQLLFEFLRQRYERLKSEHGTTLQIRETRDQTLWGAWQVFVRWQSETDRSPSLILRRHQPAVTASQPPLVGSTVASATPVGDRHADVRRADSRKIGWPTDWQSAYFRACMAVAETAAGERRSILQNRIQELKKLAVGDPDEFLRLTLSAQLQALSNYPEISEHNPCTAHLFRAAACVVCELPDRTDAAVSAVTQNDDRRESLGVWIRRLLIGRP